MKTILKWLSFFFISFFIVGIIFFYIKNVLIINKLQDYNHVLLDSLRKESFEKYYLSQLVDINSSNNILIPDNLIAYDMTDKEKLNPIDLKSAITLGKDKIIIRYSEIGCNACTDSTFNLIRNNKRILDKFDIFVLVDFTEYSYYIKWKKISEVSEITKNILWLKKGSLPFHAENENKSYLFVVDHEGKASSFFIPQSTFVKYLKKYLNGLI